MGLLELFNGMSKKEQDEFIQKIIDLINEKIKSINPKTILLMNGKEIS